MRTSTSPSVTIGCTSEFPLGDVWAAVTERVLQSETRPVARKHALEARPGARKFPIKDRVQGSKLLVQVNAKEGTTALGTLSTCGGGVTWQTLGENSEGASYRIDGGMFEKHPLDSTIGCTQF